MRMKSVLFGAMMFCLPTLAGEWIEKFYPGLEAGGKVNFLEKGYLGKEKAIEIVYASGLAKFGVAKDVETDLKGVVDWTVSAMVSGDEEGSVAAAMEFFDAKDESLKLETGRSYRTKPGIGGKENWNLATWRFTSPKKAVRASVHLLSTGKVPVRFAKVDVKSAQGVDMDEMPFNVTAWPVAWNPDWHGGEPDMVNFSDAPIPVTFALFGERDEVKEPAFEIVMPEGLEIRDAFCANYHDYGREEPTSATSEMFTGVACRRYRFENPIAARNLKRQRDLDRLYGITMVIAPKGGKPANGDYVIGYRVTCNGKKGLERTFKMKYQPLPKGLKRAPNFQVFTWTDQDRNFSRDDVYADSMKAFAAAGLITKHRNGIYRPDGSYNQKQCASKRASEIADMIKRDYPEAIISYELQDLWLPYNCRLTPELEKEVAAHMSKTIDAAHMHRGSMCPQYFTTSKKLHDHLRDNVIIADLKRFNVQGGDWVELDMEPWECQTWCFCDDCLKAFAEFHGLGRVPTIEEAGADPDKWADFRTSQGMKSTKLLAEIIHAYNPEIKVVDYDYILDYGNEKAEREFRRECAKDAFKNEKWLDGHLASYYHTIGKEAFDAIRNNVRYLKKPYYPMGGLTGYGGYLRPGEVMDDKQFRQLGLAAFVNGCPGWAFYNGTCFDGRQIIAMMRVQDDVARYGHLPWGKVDGKIVPTCSNPLFAYASTVGKDGTETLALFNYDRDASITVRLQGKDHVVPPSGVLFVTTQEISAVASEGRNETFGPGVWKSFRYEGAEMTNSAIVFTGWAKADVQTVSDFCIWLDITYMNGEHTYGRCAYFNKNRKDWQQARGVFKPGYPVKEIVVNALFRGNGWNRKGAADGTCVFRDFALERRSGTNEDFVVTSYSNRPFENTIEQIVDHFDGQRVTRSKTMVPHPEPMVSPLPNGAYRIWAAHSMRKITPLTFPQETDDEHRISLVMARNERESAQVLVSMSADAEWTSCELELPILRKDDGTVFAGEVKWERQAYLGREPGFVPHPCPIPDHEKWFPEILLSAAPMRVRACSTQGAWLTVFAATNAVMGVYTGEIVVKEGGVEKGRVPMRVAVTPVTLPHTFMMPNAFALMDGYTRRVYGADWKRFRREAQDIMLDHRLNPDDISRTELPEIEDLLHARERGMNCFNLLNVVPKPRHPTDIVLVCKPQDVFNEKFYDYFFGTLKPYVERLKEHGLEKYAYVYGFDERGPEFYDGIREFWGHMQRELPGIPLMNTAKNYVDYARGKRRGDKTLLMGDWYCPVTWDHDFTVSEEIRRETGKKVWWYTCCSGGFSNYEANMVERRIFGLQSWQVKADGFLFWMMNYWHDCGRFSETDTYFPDFKTGHWAGNAGDGFLLFPGEQHVLPTIRLAQIRDGMEDYEFAVLHDRAYGRDATMKIIERVSKFPGTGNLPGKDGAYDADPDNFLAVRKMLLKGLCHEGLR